MRLRETLNIAIDANIPQAESGGLGQALLSLVHGLAQLRDGSETYKVIVKTDSQLKWLGPHLGPNQQFVLMPRPSKRPKPTFGARLRRSVARRLKNAPASPQRRWRELPISNGFYESLGCDVIHFLSQDSFTLCALPAVFNPHDLQHLHYPRFFTPEVIAQREVFYRAGCQYANTVVVGSQWVKDDVVCNYQINADKVQVIPEHPPTHVVGKPTPTKLFEVRNKYQLEQPFILYPAVTWQHKNHVRLLEALALLRDKRNLTIRLVCTGATYAFWPRIQERINELQLSSQVKFLGFVSEEDLRAVYSLAEFLIMPSLYEAVSLPIFEAWLEGTPVACSNVTALPDQVRDAALMFDPTDVEALAEAVARMSTNTDLRNGLRARGFRRLQDFDAERTAKAYRAVYRRAAGFPLTEEDRWILSWDWMRSSEQETKVGYLTALAG